MKKPRKDFRANIRKAKTADIPVLLKNWISLMDFNKPFNPALFRRKPNALGIYKKYLTKQMRASKARVFVAELDDTIVGHIMAEISDVPPVYRINKQVYVVELYVARAFRGKGIGTQLLQEAEKWARQGKVRQFSLTANMKNVRARALYSGFGLKELHVKMVKLLD